MKSKLTKNEQNELVRLMKKIEFPAPVEIFNTWHNVFGIVCAELVVLRQKNGIYEIFLEYRNDQFFCGWHIQGRVHFPNEKIMDTLDRVIKEEVRTIVTTPKFFGWFEYPKGNDIGQCERGHAFSFVFISKPKKMPTTNATRKFFPLNQLPKNLLKGHVPVIKAISKKLNLQK